MKKSIDRFEKVLSKIEENIIFILLVGMLLSVFAGFVSRYILNSPLSWSEELARYLMIWATFIAVSYGVKTGAHITLDVLVVYLNDKANKLLRAISYIISIIYCIVVIFIGIPFVNNLINTGQTSPAMQFPMYIVYASIVVGSILMTIRYLILFYQDIVRGEKEVTSRNLEENVS